MGILDFLKRHNRDVPKDTAKPAVKRFDKYDYALRCLEQSDSLYHKWEASGTTVFDALLLHSNDDALILRASSVIYRLWSQADCDQRMQLLGRVLHSEFPSRWADFNPSVWEKHCPTAEHYHVLLFIGTAHCNGYFRESCLWLLMNLPRALPCFLLRCNDWVSLIQNIAAQSLPKLLQNASASEIAEAFPYIDRLHYCGRYRGNSEQITLPEIVRYAADKVKADPDCISHLPLRERAAAYRTLMRYTQMDAAFLHALLAQEKDINLHSKLICSYMDHSTASEEQLREWLTSKNHRVRYIAAQKLLEMNGITEDFTALLLDSCRTIRQFAAYYLQKDGVDVAAFYRSHLEDATESALLGLGEFGMISDVPMIRTYLQSENFRITAAALWAISMLDTQNCHELLWEYLFHPIPRLHKTAYFRIRKLGIRYGAKRIADAIDRTEHPILRRHLIVLMTHESSWKRLPYLLPLYNETHPGSQNTIRSAISKRNSFTTISQEQAAFIHHVLTDLGEEIPSSLRDTILLDLKYVTKA